LGDLHIRVIPLAHRPAFDEIEPAELEDLAGHPRAAEALRARL